MKTFERIARNEWSCPPRTPPRAKDLIKKLLVPTPSKRLGMRGGERDVTSHPFCAMSPQDMERLVKRQLAPPYVPELRDPLDTSNFDAMEPSPPDPQLDKYMDPKYNSVWQTEFGGD